MKLNYKNIFLFDGIGAMVSAFNLGIIFPLIQEWIGMPVNILYILSFWSAVYGIYSLGCFWVIKPKALGWLKIILAANLIYCFLTLSLMIFYFRELKSIGLTYFGIEILIILNIIFYERKIIKNQS